MSQKKKGGKARSDPSGSVPGQRIRRWGGDILVAQFLLKHILEGSAGGEDYRVRRGRGKKGGAKESRAKTDEKGGENSSGKFFIFSGRNMRRCQHSMDKGSKKIRPGRRVASLRPFYASPQVLRSQENRLS